MYGFEPPNMAGFFEFIDCLGTLGLLLTYHGVARDQAAYLATIDGDGTVSSPLVVTFGSEKDGYGFLPHCYGPGQW